MDNHVTDNIVNLNAKQPKELQSNQLKDNHPPDSYYGEGLKRKRTSLIRWS